MLHLASTSSGSPLLPMKQAEYLFQSTVWNFQEFQPRWRDSLTG